MTHGRALITRLVVTAMFSIASSGIAAQTTAPGAYYAPPAWSQTLPASTRFIVLSNFDSQAVLDRETGLVWERSPAFQHVSWSAAFSRCSGAQIGSRRGWRLPTLTELQSLIDPSQSPVLPQNHPFLNVQAFPFAPTYWSSTPAFNPGWYFSVDFFGGLSPQSFGGTSEGMLVWCVRGPQ